MFHLIRRRLRFPALFIVMLLVIEFLDEFIFGAYETALPLVRDDLNLSYDQIGLLLMLPPLLANLLFEPVIGVLGDVWRRRVLVLGGGIGFAIAAVLVAMSQSFIGLILAMILFYPSSGSFVNLAQSTLMDSDPERHEQNMARWTLAGSVGVLTGSLMIGAFVTLGLGWRSFYVLVAVMTVIILLILWRMPFPRQQPEDDEDETEPGLKAGFRKAFASLRRKEVVRWLVLLEFSDFMLDILHSYMALYFVDVAGASEVQAGLAVAIWTGVGLLGDIAIIPLLNRVRGLSYLRFSAGLEFILYTAFLLVPGITPKLILIGIIGFFNAGWYSILQGNLYSAMPGQSGTVMTLSNISGLVFAFVPLLIGMAAERLGLATAMLFPLLGCIALFVGLPRYPTETETPLQLNEED